MKERKFRVACSVISYESLGCADMVVIQSSKSIVVDMITVLKMVIRISKLKRMNLVHSVKLYSYVVETLRESWCEGSDRRSSLDSPWISRIERGVWRPYCIPISGLEITVRLSTSTSPYVPRMDLLVMETVAQKQYIRHTQ